MSWAPHSIRSNFYERFSFEVPFFFSSLCGSGCFPKFIHVNVLVNVNVHDDDSLTLHHAMTTQVVEPPMCPKSSSFTERTRSEARLRDHFWEVYRLVRVRLRARARSRVW